MAEGESLVLWWLIAGRWPKAGYQYEQDGHRHSTAQTGFYEWKLCSRIRNSLRRAVVIVSPPKGMPKRTKIVGLHATITSDGVISYDLTVRGGQEFEAFRARKGHLRVARA